mgnify:FL=1
MRKSCFIVLILLSACIGLSSCKGINRGEGYVFQWSKDANYVVMTISDTEYIHFLMDSGIGEWVNGTDISLISIGSVYQPIRNANAYRMFCYKSRNDSDLSRLFLGFDVSENTSSESFYLSNPDRKKGIIHIRNESTGNVIYASKVETSYRESIAFSITSSEWKEFINYNDSTVYRSLEHTFWYSPSTNVGEWNVNDKKIPIEIELLPYGPGLKVYDVSSEEKKLILYASGTLSNTDTLILDCIKGDMFYNNSVDSITLTKTTK